LKNAQKQFAIYQRDLKLMKEKYSQEASLDQYYKLQDTVSQKKIELQKVTQEKRNMEKALLFKEREIDVRHKENETQSKVNFLNE